MAIPTTLITRLKRILEIDHNNDDELLGELASNMSQAIAMKVNDISVPLPLEWVLVEATVMRYNRLGSEGYSQEGADVVSRTFIEDILSHYQPYFNIYLQSIALPVKPSPVIRMF